MSGDLDRPIVAAAQSSSAPDSLGPDRYPAALITESGLRGRSPPKATEAVYDSPIGQDLLIPQGARLIGQYDSSVVFGQSRLLLVWTRLIMPDGTSIVLGRQPAPTRAALPDSKTRSTSFAA